MPGHQVRRRPPGPAQWDRLPRHQAASGWAAASTAWGATSKALLPARVSLHHTARVPGIALPGPGCPAPALTWVWPALWPPHSALPSLPGACGPHRPVSSSRHGPAAHPVSLPVDPSGTDSPGAPQPTLRSGEGPHWAGIRPPGEEGRARVTCGSPAQWWGRWAGPRGAWRLLTLWVPGHRPEESQDPGHRQWDHGTLFGEDA